MGVIIESVVVALSGSLRIRSYNTALLRHAASVAPAGMTVELADIGDFPLYNSDLRDEIGMPEPVARVRRQIQQADGLLIASPEYNHSLTGVLKNAIDWLSIGLDSPITRKPTAILGTGGRLGTAKSQAALRVVLAHKDVHVVNRPEVLVAGAPSHFDEALNLVDERTGDQLRRLMFALDGQIRLDRARERAIVLTTGDEVLEHAAQLLLEAGYSVVATTDVAWAIAELKTGDLALLVVDPEVAADEQVSALALDTDTTLLVSDGVESFFDLLDATRGQ